MKIPLNRKKSGKIRTKEVFVVKVPVIIVFFLVVFVLDGTLVSSRIFAIEPEEVLVVVNKKERRGVQLGRFYMEKRKIPESRLLKINTSWKEEIDRREYEEDIAKPVREKITALKGTGGKRISTIVLFYGVPLKIRPPAPGRAARNTIERLEDLVFDLSKDGTISQITREQKIKTIQRQLDQLRCTRCKASVDSELALVMAGEYDLSGWVRNPYFLGFQNSENFLSRDEVLLVARLDGPNENVVKRMLVDTLQAEKNGLQGRACFDARGMVTDLTNPGKIGDAYTRYDYFIGRAAQAAGERMPVVFENTAALFGVGSCPDTALYCGWYSYGQYVDSFLWLPGSIGYHIASAECTTLKDENSSTWCTQMLRRGAAATIGPVNEPYVQGFPQPDIFMTRLVEGYMSLGEAYLVSLPYLSWQMVLVGDPLYQPFKPLRE